MEKDNEQTKTQMIQPAVSVLIPVYNAEKYIAECLNSLLNQSMPNWQAICVDDGSTDNSLHILQQYHNRDNRIEVVHLAQNQGLAHARNQALQRAKGKYISFLDSDDWFATDALQQAVDMFESYPKTDSVLFDCVYVYPDVEKSFLMPQFDVMTGYEAFEKSLTWQIHGVYIVRADIHFKYPYDESARTYSDENTTRLHYIASREVRKCSGIYYYRQHSASVTHVVGAQRFDYAIANQSMKQMLLDINAPKHIVDEYENLRWINIIGLLRYIFINGKQLSGDDIKHGYDILHHAWMSVETDRLFAKNKWKLGYMPMKWSWKAFLLQTRTYFILRAIKEKIF